MFKLRSIIAASAWIRELIAIAIRGASFSANLHSMRPIPARERPASPPRTPSRNAGKVAIPLVCICLGLVSVSGVTGAVLLVQVRGLKAAMAETSRDLAATKARLDQFEKIVRQTEAGATINRTAAQTPREQPPLFLSAADIQIIRQSIRMAPPQTGAQSRINVGDEIPELSARPIPESLVIALPKLQGARFSIDQAGAIIIVAGTNRVDAVIAYR